MANDPKRFQGSFLGEQSSQSLADGLKTIRENLSDDELKALLKKLGEYNENENPKTTWYRRIDNNAQFAAMLEWIRTSRTGPIGFDVWALWGGTGARQAYNTFVQLVQLLGVFESWREVGERPHWDNAELVFAAWCLSHLSHASCWMLYGWDRRLNRPALLSHGGLWFPEAVEGTLWSNGFVRHSLLDDKFTDPVSEIEGQDAERSGFRKREGIRKSWKIALRAPRARAVLLLNWRDDLNGPDPISSKYPGFLEVPEDRAILERAFHSLAVRPQVPRDLNLAVRYLNGWLTEKGARVLGPPKVSNPANVRQMIEQVARLFEPWLVGSRTAESEKDIDPSVLTGIKPVLTSILPDDEVRIIEFLSCTAKPLTLDFEPALRDEYVDRLGKPAPNYVDLTAVDERGVLPMGSSMLAQAISWRTSLLVRSLIGRGNAPRGRKKKLVDHTPKRSLRDVRLSHHERRSKGGSEIALPVVAFGQPIGGFSVELLERQLGVEHLRWMEILGFFVSGLIEISVAPALAGFRAECHDLLCGANRPRDEAELLSSYCEIVQRLCHADLVHVLSYDDARAQFRAGGAAASSGMFASLRKEMKECEEVPQAVLLRLLESDLRPQRRRRSWEIFRDGKAPRMVDISAAADTEVSRFAKRHFDVMWGLPFAITRGAAPDGALWISYRKKSDAKKGLTPEKWDAIDRISGIVACVLAAYRYANTQS